MDNPLGDCPARCPVECLARRTDELAIEQAAFAVFAAESEFNVQHLVAAVVVANLDCDGFLFLHSKSVPCRGRERAAALGSAGLRAIERAAGVDAGEGFLPVFATPDGVQKRGLIIIVIVVMLAVGKKAVITGWQLLNLWQLPAIDRRRLIIFSNPARDFFSGWR